MIIDAITVLFIVTGAFFFLAGTLGLLRFPDVYTRLHSLTKADNVGLGFIIIGLMLQTNSWFVAGKLLFIWFLILLAGSGAAYLIASTAQKRDVKLWKK